MQVIPVIDVRAGVAVAASRGDRALYRPLETPLATSPDPVAIARALIAIFPFQTLYVADLDGIEGRGANVDAQKLLAETWSGREIWIDDGVAGSENADVGLPPTLTLPTRGRELVEQDGDHNVPPPSCRRHVSDMMWGRTGGGESRDRVIEGQHLGSMIRSHVLGSESLTSLEHYERARRAAGAAAPLSLDFRGDAFIGPHELLDDATLWPDRVIVMTLARVGSGEGPDLARIGDIVRRAGSREIYAAGGVRNADDLRTLEKVGASGALVATALHNGNITTRDLEALA